MKPTFHGQFYAQAQENIYIFEISEFLDAKSPFTFSIDRSYGNFRIFFTFVCVFPVVELLWN